MTASEEVAGHPIIQIEGLTKYFPVTSGMLLRRSVGMVKAVDGISFAIRQGETYGLVGETGSGKTTTARMILMLEQPTGGTIQIDGTSLAQLSRTDYARYRASVQAVFQDPWSSLNPRMRVGPIILEPLLAHHRLSKAEARERLEAVLHDVGLNIFQADYFPHEFSGGQRQRIAIARALILRPRVIVLDEPVSALDVSIRAQVMNLLRNLQDRYGQSYFLISHNLETLRFLSHRVGVMYLGKIVEDAPTEEIFANPMHPYTRALMAAALPTRPGDQREELAISGEVPSSLAPPSGCAFHPRCPFALERCSQEVPVLREPKPGHKVSCHLF